MHRFRSLMAPLVVLLASACADGSGRTMTSADAAEPRTNVVTSVNVCCSNTVRVGSTYQVTALAIDEFGFSISNPSVTWSPSGGIVAVVGTGETATVYALNPGLSAIYATVGGVTGSVPVTVLAAPIVTTVQVLPSSVGLDVGATQPLTARAYDQYGIQMSGQTFSWSSASTAVATVSSTGVITGVAVGSTTVTATLAGKTATVPVTVYPPFSVGISGPLYIWTEGWNDWQATASGGNGTYSYQWYMLEDGQSSNTLLGQSSQQSIYVSPLTPSFDLNVDVASGGRTKTATIRVCNWIDSAFC